MTLVGKFAAVVASIALFLMPAAAMPFHCMLTAPVEPAGHPTCHHMMMGDKPAADQIAAGTPSDHSCCQVSAAKPESLTTPQSPAGKRILPPPATNAMLSDLPTARVPHEPFDWTSVLPDGPPQAVLCTFLI
jgi:predicted component of type VI protein secretion system